MSKNKYDSGVEGPADDFDASGNPAKGAMRDDPPANPDQQILDDLAALQKADAGLKAAQATQEAAQRAAQDTSTASAARVAALNKTISDLQAKYGPVPS